MEEFKDETRPPKNARSYGNNWHDGVMGEIELGSMDAYIAMAWHEDVGITRMTIWHIFAIDDLCDEGKTYEEAVEIANDTPWGPWDWTDEMLAADEDLVGARVEFEHEQHFDALLRQRP